MGLVILVNEETTVRGRDDSGVYIRCQLLKQLGIVLGTGTFFETENFISSCIKYIENSRLSNVVQCICTYDWKTKSVILKGKKN